MTMLLHARELSLSIDQKEYRFKADYSDEFIRMLTELNLLPFLND